VENAQTVAHVATVANYAGYPRPAVLPVEVQNQAPCPRFCTSRRLRARSVNLPRHAREARSVDVAACYLISLMMLNIGR
jgi:hypothetical protein